MNTQTNLTNAITAFKSGDKHTARQLLIQLLKEDPNCEAAWLWLSACTTSPEKKRQCLQKALAINPQNQHARQALDQLTPAPVLPSFTEITGAPLPPPVSAPLQYIPTPPTRAPLNATEIALIVILSLLGIYYLAGLILLLLSGSLIAISAVPGLGNAETIILCGSFFSILLAIASFGAIPGIVNRSPSSHNSLVVYAILTSIYGLISVISGSYIYICIIPLSVAVGFLSAANKRNPAKITPVQPIPVTVHSSSASDVTPPSHANDDPPTAWYQTYTVKLLTYIFLYPLWLLIIFTDRYEKSSVKIFSIFSSVIFILLYAPVFFILSFELRSGNLTIGNTPLFAKQNQITMYAYGDAPTAVIAHTGNEGPHSTETVNLPWSLEYSTSTDNPAGLFVTNDLYSYGELRCELFVNGKLVSADSASGAFDEMSAECLYQP